jgi:hypothetical protein
MPDIVRIGIYVSLVILLTSAFIWMFSELHRRFVSPEARGGRLAPVQVIGATDDAAEKNGIALAHVFLARVAEIEGRFRRARDVLLELTNERTETAGPTDLETAAAARGLPSDVFLLPDIKLTIGEVEVGGLVTRILHWAFAPSVNQIVLQPIGPDDARRGIRAVMSGPSVPDGRLAVELSTSPSKAPEGGDGGETSTQPIDTAAALDALAAALVKAVLERDTSDLDVGAFTDHEQFLSFLDVLSRLATQLRAERAGRVSSRDLEGIYGSDGKAGGLKALANALDWPSLLRASAIVAARLGHAQDVDDFLDRARRITRDPARIAAIDAQRIALARQPTAEEARNSRSPGEDPDLGARATELRAMLALPAAPGPSGSIALAGSNDQASPVVWLPGYVANLEATIRSMAPGTHVTVPGGPNIAAAGVLDDTAMVGMLNAAFAATARVVLWTYGPLSEPVLARLRELATATPDKLFVLSAGNRADATYGRRLDALPENVFVVSALDDTGRAATFAQISARAFWVPGRRVPTTGRFWDGTGPAAAVFAAALAEVLATRPQASAAELRRLLAPATGAIEPARFGEALRGAAGG